MTHLSPLELHRESVIPEYVDHNDHMNLAFFVLVFDHATDEFFDYIGLDREYRRENAYTTFALESHVTYLRELLLDAPVRVTTQLLDFDGKRAHYFHHMYHAEEGYLAATNELISMHIDSTARRSTPFPEHIQASFAAVLKSHASLPEPEQKGRVIEIRR